MFIFYKKSEKRRKDLNFKLYRRIILCIYYIALVI